MMPEIYLSGGNFASLVFGCYERHVETKTHVYSVTQLGVCL
jgi:hypothetical protein